MPVAVKLVEALTLVTIMGVILCIGLSVVMAQHTISMIVTFLQPAANIANVALVVTEKILVSMLLGILTLTNVVLKALAAAA
ncbi:uncharacterized protein [Drosophila kikkawai]|uniref:Uncharacterized protein n=1 Tax=Drosophila kikkawai TaxID=30033 RepID=A0A6P4HTC4_DROKI|nr:uncharacterized protein LOC108072281 [Drosophila kikkawai]